MLICSAVLSLLHRGFPPPSRGGVSAVWQLIILICGTAFDSSVYWPTDGNAIHLKGGNPGNIINTVQG